MKKIFILAVMAVVAVSCASEASKSAKKFDSYVEKVEKQCESFTNQDWRESFETYKALYESVKANWDELSLEEQQKCDENKGKYYGLYLKGFSTNVNEAAEKTINGLIKSLGGEE